MPNPARYRSILLVIGALFAASCSSDFPELGEAPVIVGQLDQAMSFVEVGQTLEIDVVLEEQDGSKAEFRWIWDTPESTDYTLETEVSRGALHVSFTPHIPGRMLLSGRAELKRAEGKTQLVGLHVADVRAWGGSASHPLAAHSRIELVVDEVRPTFAFPIVESLGSLTYQTLGAGPIAYSVANESVASVDSEGRVRGKSIGSTTLTMSYGAGSESIPVEVVAGSMGAPPASGTIVDEDFAAIPRRDYLRASPDGRMAADGQGHPMVVTLFDALEQGDASPGGQVVLAQWTGSGWGLELASRPFDAAEQARIAIDESGTPYALYVSHFVRSRELHDQDSDSDRAFVLAGRSSGRWQHNALSHALDGDPARDRSGDLGSQGVLRARRGGGAWALFTSTGTRLDDTAQVLCVDTLHLAELSAGEVSMHTVSERAILESEQSGGLCPDLESPNFSGADPMLDLVPRADGASLPRVVSAHAWELDCATGDVGCIRPVSLFSPGGTGFTRASLLDSFDFASASQSNDFTYLSLSVARDVSSSFGGGSIILSLDAIDELSDFARTVVVDEDGATFFSSVKSETSFGFRQGGYDYVSASVFADMKVVGPLGNPHSDPLHRGLRLSDTLAFDAELGALHGWAASSAHLYLMHAGPSGLVVYTSVMPAQIEDSADERAGVRLGSASRSPAVHTAPLIFPDNSRVIIGRERVFETRDGTDSSPAAVLISAGPNSPWLETQISGTAAVDVSESAVRLVDDRLYTMVGDELFVSSNSGVSWSSAGTSAGSDAWEIHPDGRFAGLSQSGGVWTLHLDDDVRNGLSTALGGAASFGTARPGLVFGEDGSVYMIRASGTALQYVEFVGGVPQSPVDLPLATGAEALPEASYVLADGSFIGTFVTSSASGDPFAPSAQTLHAVHRSAAGVVSIRALGPIAKAEDAKTATGRDFVSLGLLRRPDGRFVLGWTSVERETLRKRAVLATSADGLSWSEAREIRPGGGGGQLFVGMASQSNNSIVAVVSDNSAISGDISNASQLASLTESLEAPAMDDLVVRIDGL